MRPLGMDAATYEKYLDLNPDTEILSDKQPKEIEAMMDLPEMNGLKETMIRVLERKKRLEQESIDVLSIAKK